MLITLIWHLHDGRGNFVGVLSGGFNKFFFLAFGGVLVCFCIYFFFFFHFIYLHGVGWWHLRFFLYSRF